MLLRFIHVLCVFSNLPTFIIRYCPSCLRISFQFSSVFLALYSVDWLISIDLFSKFPDFFFLISMCHCIHLIFHSSHCSFQVKLNFHFFWQLPPLYWDALCVNHQDSALLLVLCTDFFFNCLNIFIIGALKSSFAKSNIWTNLEWVSVFCLLLFLIFCMSHNFWLKPGHCNIFMRICCCCFVIVLENVNLPGFKRQTCFPCSV